MMTSSNGNIFGVTGPLCGEFTPQRSVTRSFDVFFDLHRNKRLSKQPWGWWFETPSWSLWRHCNKYCSVEIVTRGLVANLLANGFHLNANGDCQSRLKLLRRHNFALVICALCISAMISTGIRHKMPHKYKDTNTRANHREKNSFF